MEDNTWDSLCSAVKDPVPSLVSEVVLEAHKWAHHLAQSKPEEFTRLLEETPPQNPTLKSILIKMSDTAQLWNTQTPVHGDTRGQDLSQIGRQQLFVVMLEGKIAGKAGSSQEWDDLTKVGQEMKLALDSILKLEPEGEVCVLGLHVR
ncbi:hypothetical protein BGZ76_006465, partial [Entomortierella beljakovae]